jgi:probable RNA-binding protein EIF1AD
MSGAKRRTKYRKHVTQEFTDSEREPVEGELYAQVIQSHGGNMFEVITSEGKKSLARLPTKFQKLIWVKRGDFVIVTSATDEYETASGAAGRVTHFIEHILNGDQVKKLKRGLTSDSVFSLNKPDAQEVAEKPPSEDLDAMKISSGDGEEKNGGGAEDGQEDSSAAGYYYESDDDESDLFVNRNRRQLSDDEDSSSDGEDH